MPDSPPDNQGMRKILLAGILALLTASVCAAADSTARFNKAIELFLLKNYAASAELLETLAAENPRSSLYWFNLANARFMAGRYDRAAEDYKKVIELDSPLANAARVYLAKSYRLGGKN